MSLNHAYFDYLLLLITAIRDVTNRESIILLWADVLAEILI